MFIILMVSLLCHFRDNTAARPGIKTFIVASMVFVISLFRTKAIPAELPGRIGSLVLKTRKRRENRVSIWLWWSVVRWVSCRHSTPIFLSLTV